MARSQHTSKDDKTDGSVSDEECAQRKYHNGKSSRNSPSESSDDVDRDRVGIDAATSETYTPASDVTPTPSQRVATADNTVVVPIGFEPSVGMRVKKKFGGCYFHGTIKSGPELVESSEPGVDFTVCWSVLFDDGDLEDMSRQELYECFDENRNGKRPRNSSSKIPDDTENVGVDTDLSSSETSKQASDAAVPTSQKVTTADTTPAVPVGFEPTVGMRIKKEFDGRDFHGTIKSGPELVDTNEPGVDITLGWRVHYDDGDVEDLTRQELFECCDDPEQPQAAAIVTPDSSKPVSKRVKKNEDEDEDAYTMAKSALCSLPGMTETDVDHALKQIGPPYGLQSVMHEIHKNRTHENWSEPGSTSRFVPHVGMRVRKMFDGKNYYGTVTKDAELKEVPTDDIESDEEPQEVWFWEVTFDDGDIDDMDWTELFRCRADRPIRPAPCRGRQLQSLELFSGRGVVTQEFCDRKWKVCSIDSSDSSNATVKNDILNIKPTDLEFVPDFIWASPPCHTYSNMAGGKHRKVEDGKFELTPEAQKNNVFFVRMAEIIHWAKAKHPHLIVVIENPVGLMKKMPLMQELSKKLGLYCATVHYCAFGRDDKKPTCLWTNDFGLYSTLGEFTCENRCPYKAGIHPISCRGSGSMYNAASIPQPLAEEVAEFVNAKFYQDRIRYTIAADQKASSVFAGDAV